MEQIESKLSDFMHTLDPLGGLKGQNIFFTVIGQVAYQIKAKEVQNKMKANCMTIYTSLTSWDGLKGSTLKLCR